MSRAVGEQPLYTPGTDHNIVKYIDPIFAVMILPCARPVPYRPYPAKTCSRAVPHRSYPAKCYLDIECPIQQEHICPEISRRRNGRLICLIRQSAKHHNTIKSVPGKSIVWPAQQSNTIWPSCYFCLVWLGTGKSSRSWRDIHPGQRCQTEAIVGERRVNLALGANERDLHGDTHTVSPQGVSRAVSRDSK